ncbi:hypothetical protein BO86DRAFT_25889 [Aspergillus japonicus CBS 114.51]|uniref:Transmembrane protein n=1 Tax=Aspergillus japonicus CBS 114.51 TaxID=1448312 RepID=A0A8T8X7L9_ASPJA|nr:hypothetical protein BO86DRAFT_25889 [Aspergillus japonicus CBS 114.51]RAH84005.1 hypothetical protein BO86DRAFT_25889 [Aspergillus japonicus CBS 114.51]
MGPIGNLSTRRQCAGSSLHYFFPRAKEETKKREGGKEKRHVTLILGIVLDLRFLGLARCCCFVLNSFACDWHDWGGSPFYLWLFVFPFLCFVFTFLFLLGLGWLLFCLL